MFRSILSALAAYLKDWKNLVVHALIGAALLLFALKAPLPGWVRILVLAAVVAFNIARGRLEKSRKKTTQAGPEATG